MPVKCPRSIPSTAPGRGCKDAASAAHRGLPESPRAWLTPSPSCWTLSNDGRNMVVARRRLFSPWTRQPTGYGCILWAGKRRRRRGPSRRPHGPERASRQGCPPRKRRRASPRPSPTRRRSRRRGPPRSRGVAARAWASGLRHGAPNPRGRSCLTSQNDDRVLGPPDLDRTSSIQRPKMNQGWTVFQIPSTPGRDLEYRPPWGTLWRLAGEPPRPRELIASVFSLLDEVSIRRIPACPVPTVIKDQEEMSAGERTPNGGTPSAAAPLACSPERRPIQTLLSRHTAAIT